MRFAPPSLPSPTAASGDASESAVIVLAPMKHVPDWVQTRRPATLWSGADTHATPFTDLPAWTFLKVTGVQQGRLSVQYAGDGQSRQAGPGWVALDDVQPSDSGEGWLRNHRPSQLFAASSGSAAAADVPQWSWMLGLGDTAGDRVHVRLYASTLQSIVGDGWIPASDVGPSGPPSQSVYTPATKRASADAVSHDAFVASIAAASRGSSIPVSVTIAQAILESDWGQSALSREANNFFGIKASGAVGNDGAVWMPTLEYAQGGSYTVIAPFRAYKSMADSVADHTALFQELGAYRDALQAAGSPDEFARRIAHDGYASDPAYADKVIGLMQRYNLYQYDARPGVPEPSLASQRSA